MSVVDRLAPRHADKTVLVGNPVRDTVARLAKRHSPVR